MRKIAVSISKGGTGKTTTAVNVAAGLAMAGARVLGVAARETKAMTQRRQNITHPLKRWPTAKNWTISTRLKNPLMKMYVLLARPPYGDP